MFPGLGLFAAQKKKKWKFTFLQFPQHPRKAVIQTFIRDGPPEPANASERVSVHYTSLERKTKSPSNDNCKYKR